MAKTNMAIVWTFVFILLLLIAFDQIMSVKCFTCVGCGIKTYWFIIELNFYYNLCACVFDPPLKRRSFQDELLWLQGITWRREFFFLPKMSSSPIVKLLSFHVLIRSNDSSKGTTWGIIFQSNLLIICKKL